MYYCLQRLTRHFFNFRRKPFPALAFYQLRSEFEVVEDLCARIAEPVVTISTTALNDRSLVRVWKINVLFSLEELDTALVTCRRSSSPGPDGIMYAALCQHGDDARGELLNYYNKFWHNDAIPKQ